MKRILFAAAVVAALSLTACDKPGMGEVDSGNSAVPLTKLLVTPEGCNVYRFADSGHNNYTTICPAGDKASTSSTQSCGKNCERPVQVDTVTAPQ